MDYQKHYDLLIERAKTRIIDGYVEKHHIIPKCMGGSDNSDNLVILTPEEHYVAHQLLVKIYPSVKELTFAVKMMTIGNDNKHQRSNKLYGWLRKKFVIDISTKLKGRKMTDEQRQKMSEAKKGKTWSDAKRKSDESKPPITQETRDKLSKALKGRPKTEEHKQKCREAMTGRYTAPSGPRDLEIVKKIAASNTGKKRTLEQRERMSIAAKNRKKSND